MSTSRGRQVVSVDIDPDLVDAARDRLAEIGFSPGLFAVDGSLSLGDGAGFDRIIATCAVETIPASWVAQLLAGGIIVADLRTAVTSTLVVLRKLKDGAVTGRLMMTPGYFMPLRHEPSDPLGADRPVRRHDLKATVTGLATWPVEDLASPDFLTWLHARCGELAVLDIFPGVITIADRDGSYAELHSEGSRWRYSATGPRNLADRIGAESARWRNAGRPTGDRIGLTVDADGRHTFWLDEPDNPIAEREPR